MYEILYQNGLITITTFNTFLALAFILGALFLVRFIQMKKIKLSFFVNNFFYLIIAPLIAGRIFYIFEHLSFFKEVPLQTLAIWDFKFSSFGIFYGLIIILYILCRREREDFWGWLDAFALTGLAGLIFIHIGHFFNGTHYGTPTDLPWGMAFDTFNIPFIKPIHPVQIYSSIITFIIFSIGIHSAKRTHLTGVSGTFTIMLYAISAFGIDFLHGAPSTYAKVNYLIVAALAFIFYINSSHKKLFSQS
jgi:phosphatidylglycerol---prolipoprotein diacylglyceryl transferase